MPTGRPSLSVVVPVRDDAAALGLCLRLLARQTCPPLEVVVVDNASRDDSAAVARAGGARVVHEPVLGIPAASSAGLDAARGDVLVRCDADSVPPLDWLERIGDRFAADPGLEALTGSGDFYGVSRWRAALLGTLYLRSFHLSMYAALAHPPLWGSNMALRRSTWQVARVNVNRLDAEMHDDVDLSLALPPSVRIAYDPSLRVGVSGRSLRGRRQTVRRFVRAFRTLDRGWARMPPWSRWAVRLSRER